MEMNVRPGSIVARGIRSKTGMVMEDRVSMTPDETLVFSDGRIERWKTASLVQIY